MAIVVFWLILNDVHDTLKKRNYPYYAVAAGILLIAASSLGVFDRSPQLQTSPQPATSADGKVKLSISKTSIDTMVEASIAENPTLRENEMGVRSQYQESAMAQEMIVAEALTQDIASKDPIVRNRLSELFIMSVYQQADASITPQAAMKYYENHRDKYMAPEKRLMAHIFVRVTNATDDAKARATIERLRKTALGPESKWDDDFRKAVEPAYFTRDELRESFGPTFSMQVFAMSEGDWSEPIQTTSGWHCVKIIERRPARLLDFAEARSEVESDLKAELRMEYYMKEIERLKSKYEVEITP